MDKQSSGVKFYSIYFEDQEFIIPIEKSQNQGKQKVLYTGLELRSLFWEQLAEKIKCEGNKQELHPQGAFQLYLSGELINKQSLKDNIAIKPKHKQYGKKYLEMKLYKVTIAYLRGGNFNQYDNFQVVISLKEDFNMLKQKIHKHFYQKLKTEFPPNRQLLYKKKTKTNDKRASLNPNVYYFEEMTYKSTFEQYKINTEDIVILKLTKTPPKYNIIGISGLVFIFQILGSLIYLISQILMHQHGDTYYDPKSNKERPRKPEDPLAPEFNPLSPEYSVGLLTMKIWGQMFGDTFATLLYWWLYQFLDIFGIVIFILAIFSIVQVILCGLGMKERNLVRCFVVFFTLSFLIAQALMFYLKLNENNLMKCEVFQKYVNGEIQRINVGDGEYEDPEGIYHKGYGYLQEMICTSSWSTILFEFTFGLIALVIYWMSYRSIKIHSKVEQNSNFLSMPEDNNNKLDFPKEVIDQLKKKSILNIQSKSNSQDLESQSQPLLSEDLK